MSGSKNSKEYPNVKVPEKMPWETIKNRPFGQLFDWERHLFEKAALENAGDTLAKAREERDAKIKTVVNA